MRSHRVAARSFLPTEPAGPTMAGHGPRQRSSLYRGQALARNQVQEPMQPSLVPYVRVADARASSDYYCRCLGFAEEWVHQFEPGLPLCISVRRGDLRLFLSEHCGDGNFGICLYCYIEAVDDYHAACLAAGARQVSSVDTMPWGRDFSVQDLDGNQLRFGAPHPAV